MKPAVAIGARMPCHAYMLAIDTKPVTAAAIIPKSRSVIFETAPCDDTTSRIGRRVVGRRGERPMQAGRGLRPWQDA